MSRQLVCPSCGEDEQLAGERGEIVGWRQVPLCVVCDADMLSRSLAGKPVPNNYQPAAKTRREPGSGSDPASILPR